MQTVELSDCRSSYMSTVPNTLVMAYRLETCRRCVIALFLLLGILSISELAKIGPCLVSTACAQRFLRLTRLGEPSTEQAGDNVTVARAVTSRPHLARASVAPAYSTPDDLRPSLTRFRFCSQLRSPPRIK